MKKLAVLYCRRQLIIMQNTEKPHPTKRLFLAGSVVVFAVLSGGGLVYAAGRDLANYRDPITALLFIVGALMSTLMLVTASEARRRDDSSLRFKLALLVVAVAICDGRFVSHFVLRGQCAVAEAEAPTAGLKADVETIGQDIAARESRIADLAKSIADRDTDGDSSNDKGVKADRLLIADLRAELAARRGDLTQAQERLHGAEGKAAGVAYEQDPILLLTAGLSDRQRLLAVWAVFAALFWLVESTLIDNARGIRILSEEPEPSQPEASRPIPAPVVFAPIPPDGGTPNGKLNGHAVAFSATESKGSGSDRQRGLRYRNDGRRKRALHERRIRGVLHTIPLPAHATAEELAQTAEAVNRMVDAALAGEAAENVIPFQRAA